MKTKKARSSKKKSNRLPNGYSEFRIRWKTKAGTVRVSIDSDTVIHSITIPSACEVRFDSNKTKIERQIVFQP